MRKDLDTGGMAAEIVATCRTMLETGLVVGTWGNVSRRCGRGCLLITPSGIPYPALEAEDLVAVGSNGKPAPGESGRRHPSTETLLHAEIYRARPDVEAVVHTHSPYASVFAVTGVEIPPVLEEMAQLIGGGVRVARYALPGTKQLGEAAVAALEDRSAVLLANHGVVGVGRTLQEALTVCQVVEKSAQVFLWAKLSGSPHLLDEQEVQELRRGFLQNYGQPGTGARQ